MDPLLKKIANRLLKLHKEVCILRETVNTKEEFDFVSVRTKAIRECLHTIGMCLEEADRMNFAKMINEKLEILAEAMYFEEILKGV